MGMFDTIRCNYDLGPGFWNKELQTKDLQCACCQYWLDPSGRLWEIDYSGTQDFVDVPIDDNHPWLSFKTVGNGNHGKVRPLYVTKSIEVYPSEWTAYYAPYPRQTITFVEGQLCMKN